MKIKKFSSEIWRGECYNQFMQKGFSAILIIIGAIVTLAVIGGIYYSSRQKSNATPPTTVQPSTTFQELLKKHCSMRKYNEPYRGLILEESKINLSVLPIKIALDDLTSNQGICDEYGSYVFIPLGDEDFTGYESTYFVTISDSNSNHCCEGPSSIDPTGKLIKNNGSTSIYIHTGHWGEGPSVGYKPIIVRGVKTIKLPNREEIRIVLDRKALDKNDVNLQKIEAKYQVIDSNYGTGEKVSTLEGVEKMLMDNFFANFSDSPVVKKVESDLQSITIKN